MFPLPDSGVELGPDPSKKDSCTGMRSMENNLDEFKGRVALIKKEYDLACRGLLPGLELRGYNF